MQHRVLFAEDDEAIHGVIAEFLRSEGFVIDSAFNGREAVGLLGHAKYDAAVLDVSMPLLDGGGVLAAMHELQPALVSRTVLISAFPDAVQDELRSRAYAVLQKPFRLDHLLAHISTVLGHSTADARSTIEQP